MATDVNPQAEPIKLNTDSGLDPNQHNPNNDGNFIDKAVNKNVDKVLQVSQVADAVIASATLGVGVGLIVYAGYALIRHLINRWDINIAKLFTDPFGFFGGSAFRSTRYFHYFTQFSQEQSEYLADPINTYAASAVASNQDIGSSVISAIQTGKGNKLKRYYQYSTLRFANRDWDWRLDRAKDISASSLKVTNALLAVTATMPKRFEIVQQNQDYSEYGVSYLAWVQENFGLDEFHTEYQGKQYEVLQPPVLLETGEYAIAETESNEYLTVTSIPVKPSKGLVYWTNSTAPKNLQVESDYVTETLVFSDVPANYPTSESAIGELTWVDEDYRWTNPYEVNSKDEDGSENSDSTETITQLSGGLLYSKFVTLKSIDKSTSNTKYEYSVTIVASYVGYDEEHFFWIEEDGSTNNEQVAALFNYQPEAPTLAPVIASNTSKVFKLYPYLPLREWTKGRHAGHYDFPIVPSEFTEALKQINELSSTETNEDTEANVTKNERKIEQTKREDSRKTAKDGTTQKTLQRQLQRGLASKRKVTVAQLVNMKKPMSNSALKRHVNQMSDLLGIDFDYEAANFTASNYHHGDVYSGGYYVSHLLMPAVNFATNVKEVHRYLYTFFNRLYNLYGRESQVKNWYATVASATSLSDIQVNKLEWVNQSTMDWGGMSWLFINKFKLTGNVRSIRRNHRYYDVLRGKPISITTLQELQSVVEPLHEVADDKHYTSKNGVEYCIGGELFNGNGLYEDGNSVSECFKNYDYTYFARQSGENEITVIAVAGLSFTTKLSEMTRWSRAWHDLELHYSRNKQKYVDKNQNPNATDEIERSESKKHKHYNVISHWGILPLDYRTLTRMGGTELERFAQRAVVHYGFIKSEQKGKRKGLKPVMVVAQVIVFIVSLVLSIPSGGTSLSLNAVAQAAVQAIVTSVVVNLATRYLLVPLLKSLGLRGIVALIIAIVVALAANMVSGAPPDSQSVLPYASEVGKQTAVEVSQSIMQDLSWNTLSDALQQSLSNAVTDMLSNAFSMASNLLSASNKAFNELNQAELESIQQQSAQAQTEYNNAMNELQEQQEELQLHAPNFDVKEVMSNLRLRFKMYEPNNFIMANTMPDEFTASYDYLENFINMKLDLNPETFDPVRSLDFSFNRG